MKVQILQENLSHSLSLASRFVSTKAQLPILSNILLRASGTKLTICATNLETSLTTSIGAKVNQEGEITVPARVLSDLVINLPKGAIVLETDKEQLNIKSEQFSGNVLGLNSSEFPVLPSKTDKTAVEIATNDFIKALSQVVFSSSPDITRPVLTGVLFIIGDEVTQLVATDGFRLSRKTINIKSKTSGKVIVPKGALIEFARIFAGEDKIYLEIREEDKQVIFSSGDTVLSSRVIEGDLPPYEKIIPKQSAISVRVYKEELLRGIKVAQVMARDAGYVGKMEIKRDLLEISAESSKSGSQKMGIEAKVEGGELEIMYNLHFVEEFLNIVAGDEVLIELNDPGSPGVFKDISDSGFLHLIMPVKL